MIPQPGYPKRSNARTPQVGHHLGSSMPAVGLGAGRALSPNRASAAACDARLALRAGLSLHRWLAALQQRTRRMAHDTRHSPRLSIGLPVYNGERYLAEAFDCFLAQSFQDFEIIICDNASTDRTAEICRSYAQRDPRIRYYR